MGMHEYTRSPQDYWSNSFRLFLIYFYFFEKLVLLTCFVDIKEKKDLNALSLINAPYSCQSMWEIRKKKKGWQCNISDLAPYYTACFHFMPV